MIKAFIFVAILFVGIEASYYFLSMQSTAGNVGGLVLVISTIYGAIKIIQKQIKK